MKKVSCVINEVIGTCPTLLINIKIKSFWKDIIGDEFSDFAIFHEAKYSGKNQLSVIIKVISSASILIKYGSSKIIENISRLTGVPEIKLIIQHSSFELEDKINEDKISKTKLKEICKISEKFDNDSLKNALERLKTEMQDAA